MEKGSKILGGISLYQFPASKIGFSESRKLRVIFLALWWPNYFSDLMFESISLNGLLYSETPRETPSETPLVMPVVTPVVTPVETPVATPSFWGN